MESIYLGFHNVDKQPIMLVKSELHQIIMHRLKSHYKVHLLFEHRCIIIIIIFGNDCYNTFST
jgi:hypothetical protein